VIHLPKELQTNRLRLRAPVRADAAVIFEEYAADPEVTRYMTWVPHRTSDTVAEFLEILDARADSGEEFGWVLTNGDVDRVIGMIGARIRDFKVEIGYVLGRAHWGKGYMTEAVSALAECLLFRPEVFRVWAVCDIENRASARVLEKANFAREGILRRWMSHPNISPEPRDCFIYGRVR
jgi:RimJ/RimL family protein N-acetyltransferase